VVESYRPVRLTRCTEKTAKQTTDIILYDGKVIVFKMESDVMLYVVGSADENEVLLYRYGHGTAECWAEANTCTASSLR